MEKLSIFKSLADAWPSSIVARQEVGRFSGGLLTPKRLANLDAQGLGPSGRICVAGRKIGYPVAEIIAWLDARSVRVPDRHPANK